MAKHSNTYAVSLYYFAKFWGLAPFTWTSSRPCVGSSKEVLYSFILVLLCVIQFFSTMVNRLSMDYAGLTTMTSIGNNLFTHLGDLTGGLCVVTFALKRKNLVHIINTSYKIDGVLAVLGVEQNYENISKRLATVVGLSSAAILIVVCTSSLIYWISAGSAITLWTSYSYVVGSFIHLIHHHVGLLFVIAMDFVRNRYEQLNDRLIDLCLQEPALNHDPDRHNLSTNRETLLVASVADVRRNNQIDPGSGEILKPSEKLRKIAELSDILHEVTDGVVEVASLPIMVNLFYYFTVIVTVIYYLFITTPKAYAASDYVTMAQLCGSGFWIGVILCELLATAAVCSSTQKTASSTASILHKIWHQYHVPELKDEIQMLSLQLLQRPLTISAFEFFSLDYSYLYKIFCAVVAYFIIMVQLDTSKLEPSPTNSTLNGT